ncbi:MAG TPA: hypothetical protein VMT69_03495 [Kineosporiaceae bacterium]|nr:hypothetical protein [Kineosporiaceae bacterium]
MTRTRQVIGIIIVAFLIYAVYTNPAGVANVVLEIWNIIVSFFQSVVAFFNHLIAG